MRDGRPPLPPPPAPRPVRPLPEQQRDLLHWLGHVYLGHGQPRRALVLLMLAARDGAEPGLWPAVALALVECGMGQRALEVIGWIEAAGDDPAAPRAPELLLLRARALHAAGRAAEARLAFGDFVAARAAQAGAPQGGIDG